MKQKTSGQCVVEFKDGQLERSCSGGGIQPEMVTHLALPVDPDDAVAPLMLGRHKDGVRTRTMKSTSHNNRRNMTWYLLRVR